MSNLTVQTPKKGSLIVPNNHNSQLAPKLSQRYKKSQIQEVIEKAHGMTASICHALDCTHQQFYVYLRKHPDLKKLQEDCRQDMIDKAEAVIMDNLESPSEMTRQKAAEFILSRLGGARGWGTNPMIGVQINSNDQTKTIQAIFGID